MLQAKHDSGVLSPSACASTQHLPTEKPSASDKPVETNRNISYPPPSASVVIYNSFAGHTLLQGGWRIFLGAKPIKLLASPVVVIVVIVVS